MRRELALAQTCVIVFAGVFLAIASGSGGRAWIVSAVPLRPLR